MDIVDGVWIPFVPNRCPNCGYKQSEPIGYENEFPTSVHRCPKCDLVYQVHVWVDRKGLLGGE